MQDANLPTAIRLLIASIKSGWLYFCLPRLPKDNFVPSLELKVGSFKLVFRRKVKQVLAKRAVAPDGLLTSPLDSIGK